MAVINIKTALSLTLPEEIKKKEAAEIFRLPAKLFYSFTIFIFLTFSLRSSFI